VDGKSISDIKESPALADGKHQGNWLDGFNCWLTQSPLFHLFVKNQVCELFRNAFASHPAIGPVLHQARRTPGARLYYFLYQLLGHAGSTE
jgi:hypothetical protein